MATPATDNPRYRLATLAGTDLSDTTVWDENRHLWNEHQQVFLDDKFKSDDPHMAVLPKLSTVDLGRITAIEGLAVTPDARTKINFQGVEFPDVTFAGFYFGFDAWFDNATFSKLAGFYNATFHGEVRFTDAPQTSKAARMSFKQANFT